MKALREHQEILEEEREKMRREHERDKHHRLQVKAQINAKKEAKTLQRERELQEMEEAKKLEDLRRMKMNDIVHERLQVILRLFFVHFFLMVFLTLLQDIDRVVADKYVAPLSTKLKAPSRP